MNRSFSQQNRTILSHCILHIVSRNQFREFHRSMFRIVVCFWIHWIHFHYFMRCIHTRYTLWLWTLSDICSGSDEHRYIDRINMLSEFIRWPMCAISLPDFLFVYDWFRNERCFQNSVFFLLEMRMPGPSDLLIGQAYCIDVFSPTFEFNFWYYTILSICLSLFLCQSFFYLPPRFSSSFWNFRLYIYIFF